MRFLLLAVFVTCVAVSAEAQGDESQDNPYDPLASVPAPLREAVRKVGRDAGRWAFTMHTISRDRKGRVIEDVVARYDPSRHYDEQWTLLKKDGKDATESQIKKHRKQRAKLEKRRRPFGELLEFERAELVADPSGGPGVLTYRVPLRPAEDDRFPIEKVEVFVRVDEAAQSFRNIELKLREPLRAFLVAKLKEGGALLEFETVDPAHPPTLTKVTLAFGASLAFVPVGLHTEITRGEFRRVKPYDERFQVKLGPLRTIDF